MILLIIKTIGIDVNLFMKRTNRICLQYFTELFKIYFYHKTRIFEPFALNVSFNLRSLFMIIPPMKKTY